VKEKEKRIVRKKQRIKQSKFLFWNVAGVGNKDKDC